MALSVTAGGGGFACSGSGATSSTSHPLYGCIAKHREEGKKIWVLFGLSANPIHLGHVSYVERIAEALRPDRIIVIPAKVNPQKTDIFQLDAIRKEETARAAFAHREALASFDVVIDTRELKREEASYTWKTVGEVSREAIAAGAELYLLMTDETAEGFPTWYEPKFIAEHATIVYGSRPGASFDKIKFINTLKKINELAIAAFSKDTEVEVATSSGERTTVKIEGRHIRRIDPTVIEALDRGHIPVAGTLSVSSTEIRECLDKGESIDHLVGREVTALLEGYRALDIAKKATA